MFLILEVTVESGLGSVDEHAITTAVDQASTSRGKYKIYSDEKCYKIGKCTNVHGSAATVRKFKFKFPELNKLTCRSIKKKYEKRA